MIKKIIREVFIVFLEQIIKSSFGRKLIERMHGIADYSVGIGSGSDCQNSGEHKFIEFFFKNLQKRKLHMKEVRIIFDVGANKGQFLELLLETSQKFSKFPPPYIHSFEASKITFKILKQNVATLNLDNVTLNNFALGVENGKARIYYDEQGSGLASLTKRQIEYLDIHFNKSEEIEIMSIDEYCKDKKIDRIDLLKIDVEGHELDVLNGGKEMLRGDRINIILFEFGGCNIDTRTYFRDFWFLLNDKYNIYRLTPSGRFFYIANYAETLEQFVTTNFVAFRKNFDCQINFKKS